MRGARIDERLLETRRLGAETRPARQVVGAIGRARQQLQQLQQLQRRRGPVRPRLQRRDRQVELDLDAAAVRRQHAPRAAAAAAAASAPARRGTARRRRLVTLLAQVRG